MPATMLVLAILFVKALGKYFFLIIYPLHLTTKVCGTHIMNCGGDSAIS